jgi:hypothetical protein
MHLYDLPLHSYKPPVHPYKLPMHPLSLPLHPSRRADAIATRDDGYTSLSIRTDCGSGRTIVNPHFS